MSEKGSEPDIEPRRFNVAEVPLADIWDRAPSRFDNQHRTAREMHNAVGTAAHQAIVQS